MAKEKSGLTLKTKNHDLFKFPAWQREVNMFRANRLAESIKEENLLFANPIVVNEKHEVIDGQHRLIAAKICGVDIFYTVVEGADQTWAIRLNTNTNNWKADDFLNYHSNLGMKEYLKIDKIIKESGLGLSTVLILAGNASTQISAKKTFHEGDFQCKRSVEQINNYIVKIQEFIDYIRVHSNKVPIYTNSRNFWRACIAFIDSGVDWSYFIERLDNNFQLLRHVAKVEDFYAIFAEIYNYKKRSARVESKFPGNEKALRKMEQREMPDKEFAFLQNI